MHLSLSIRTFTEASPPIPLKRREKVNLHAYDELSHCKNQREHKSRVLVSSHTKTLMGTSLENIQINGHDRQRLLTSAFHLNTNEAPF